jgi:predicted RNA-binding protein with PIN domain
MIQLLIDGHNLIPRIPGLSLSQIDDEEKLVGLLRKYATHHRAQIVVVFDSGNLTGRSRELSGGGVEVTFAGSSTNADRILIERIRELKRPQQWKLVSSDHAVQEEANRRRVRVVEAAEFAGQLMSPRDIERPTSASADEKPDTEADIDEWLKLFKRT